MKYNCTRIRRIQDHDWGGGGEFRSVIRQKITKTDVKTVIGGFINI